MTGSTAPMRAIGANTMFLPRPQGRARGHRGTPVWRGMGAAELKRTTRRRSPRPPGRTRVGNRLCRDGGPGDGHRVRRAVSHRRGHRPPRRTRPVRRRAAQPGAPDAPRGRGRETQFAADLLEQGVAGLPLADMRTYLEHVADRRLAALGLDPECGAKICPASATEFTLEAARAVSPLRTADSGKSSFCLRLLTTALHAVR